MGWCFSDAVGYCRGPVCQSSVQICTASNGFSVSKDDHVSVCSEGNPGCTGDQLKEKVNHRVISNSVIRVCNQGYHEMQGTTFTKRLNDVWGGGCGPCDREWW